MNSIEIFFTAIAIIVAIFSCLFYNYLVFNFWKGKYFAIRYSLDDLKRFLLLTEEDTVKHKNTIELFFNFYAQWMNNGIKIDTNYSNKEQERASKDHRYPVL